ncbi:glycoside hydrolase family 16 protein [Gordonia sp. PKS22-38]|uniref:Glycoside hydrolase family 16 protein n=1 Tax=Gordonia prachuapensis TaxID=3115651 RepID=A0ABU7MP22_9ACTN|nr:glycoside hydrolase family 16 protein [Gordonia sp. PKS22-38]
MAGNDRAAGAPSTGPMPVAAGKCAASAADTHGWGSPARSDQFTGAASLNDWHLYDGPGHDGNGRRTPDAVSVSGGDLVIRSDLRGNSGGLTPRWSGQKYGRWEICARSTMAAFAWHPVALLWPVAEDWPVGGEIDFMEISDPWRQRVEYNLHYGAANHVEQHVTRVNATRWHSWAVEWTPQRIAVYRDGVQWAVSTDTGRLPPRPMRLALQLDYFGGPTFPTGAMFVDWVNVYGL